MMSNKSKSDLFESLQRIPSQDHVNQIRQTLSLHSA